MSNPKLDQQKLIDRWARWVNHKGLTAVALPLLEVGRSLGFLGAQALLMAQPILGLMLDGNRVSSYVALLEDPKALGQLIEQIEQEAASRD